jgi:hypothetical protein
LQSFVLLKKKTKGFSLLSGLEFLVKINNPVPNKKDSFALLRLCALASLRETQINILLPFQSKKY